MGKKPEYTLAGLLREIAIGCVLAVMVVAGVHLLSTEIANHILAAAR